MGALVHAILVLTVLVGSAVFLMIFVNLASIPRLSRVRRHSRRTPRVSIVIPARNEEQGIEPAVRSHLAQQYPDFEVIVVDDRSTDATAAILAEIARQDARLRVIAGSEPPPGWLGKPHALSQGARAAFGEVLLFADADVLYDPRCLGEAVADFEGRQLDFLAFLPRMEARGFWENVLMPNIPAAFFLGPGFLANLDSPRWVAAGGGAGNMIRRSVYEAVGGHEAIKDSVIDDLRLALKTKRAGFRARFVRAEDRVAVRMYRGFREVWDGFTKNMAYVFNGALGALLLLLTGLSVLVSVTPPLVLFFLLLGGEVPARDVLLAAAGVALALLARTVLALALGDPLWPALTHPIMTAVWAGIVCRSLYWRFVKRKLFWRGRQYEAARARF